MGSSFLLFEDALLDFFLPTAALDRDEPVAAEAPPLLRVVRTLGEGDLTVEVSSAEPPPCAGTDATSLDNHASSPAVPPAASESFAEFFPPALPASASADPAGGGALAIDHPWRRPRHQGKRRCEGGLNR